MNLSQIRGKIQDLKKRLNEGLTLSPNNYDISVLLATLRPGKARRCIEGIAQTSEGVNYEVVVVSPLDMPNLLMGCKGYERVTFVQEEKKEGCNKAYSTACEHASGKYVIAIADDSLLAEGCLKNLLTFMQAHDNELFLAGVRFFDAYGPGPECKVYGFYYPFNPCLRRDLVPQLGGFYDLCYRSYYGDPDLAMRVWHKGGKAELCPDAWIELCNEYDDVDLEARSNNLEKDFITFRERWHPVYGHLVNSDQQTDINTANLFALPGLPPAKCTRLLNHFIRRDWISFQNELTNKDKSFLNRNNLTHLFKEMVANYTVIPIDIQENLLKWLINQIINDTLQESVPSSSSTPTSYQLAKIAETANPSDRILASIAMYVLTGGLKRYPEIVVDNYRGISIIFNPRLFYAWPFSPGGFSIDAFQRTTDRFAFSDSKLSQVVSMLDQLIGDAPLVDMELIKAIESNLTHSNLDLNQDNLANGLKLEQLPKEMCLRVVLYLKLKAWNKLEELLNNASTDFFVLKKHLCYVYDELVRNTNSLPVNLRVGLSHWLLVQTNAFSSHTNLVVSEAPLN